MNIFIVCKYTVISSGLFYMLNSIYDNVNCSTSLNSTINKINLSKDSLLIYGLLKSSSKDVDSLISFKSHYPKTKLLIIDFSDNYNNCFFKFSKIGIEGYLLASFVKDDLLNAIDKIEKGSRFYDKDLIYKLVDNEKLNESATTLPLKESSLTKRETEILCQLSKGYSNYEISLNLNISENTVKKHISNIFIKINVKDRTQATIYAYEIGLVS